MMPRGWERRSWQWHWWWQQQQQQVPVFGNLKIDVETNWKKWKKWNNETNPEVAELPDDWGAILNQFQKILLLNAFRPDRLTTALITWVKESMGDRYIEMESFNILHVYRESNPSQPIFFVLFPGSDIFRDLQPICEKYDYTIDNGKFVNISMGQGQEKVCLLAANGS